MSSKLYEALAAADPKAPPALEVFDRVVASHEPSPDFYEHSVRVAERISPHRLTYYFDTHRRGAGVAREAGRRFVALARELSLPLPAPLSSFVESSTPGRPEVLQVVLGVDADGAGLRAKYYLVFRDDPGACVRELLVASGLMLAAPTGTDPAKVYIVGVDVNARGVEDVKLYFRLDPSLTPKVIENVADVADLLRETRDVVYQQCTARPERRQVYLHARSAAFLSRWLDAHGKGEALGRARAITERLQGSRLDPWIVSFAYDRRRLDLGQSNVYFHLGEGADGRQ